MVFVRTPGSVRTSESRIWIHSTPTRGRSGSWDKDRRPHLRSPCRPYRCRRSPFRPPSTTATSSSSFTPISARLIGAPSALLRTRLPATPGLRAPRNNDREPPLYQIRHKAGGILPARRRPLSLFHPSLCPQRRLRPPDESDPGGQSREFLILRPGRSDLLAEVTDQCLQLFLRYGQRGTDLLHQTLFANTSRRESAFRGGILHRLAEELAVGGVDESVRRQNRLELRRQRTPRGG